MGKLIRGTLLALGAVIVLLVASALGYRALRQHENAEALKITTPNGIAEAGYVKIGGADQWIQVRGEDRDNPVIVFIHGGPGMSVIPFMYETMRPWEHSFTVVHWDQRGAGRTYMRNGRDKAPAATIDQVVKDGIEVAEYARAHLHKDKVIIVGVSWGSIVGTEMARRRPDLFYAYVGTGQVVDNVRNEQVGYRLLMDRIRKAGDTKAIAALRKIGPPPYASFKLLREERDILNNHPLASERGAIGSMLASLVFAPGYSLQDDVDILGTQNVPEPLVREVFAYDGPARGMTFAIPMFYFQGSDDIQTPTEIVEDYFSKLTAPRKELVLFPGGGHYTVGVFSAQFLKELETRVRPLAMADKR